MKVKDIIKILDSLYPQEAKASFDNVGLMVGSRESDVSKIYISLDITDEVLEDAIECGAQMIVTHHPLIFTPIKSLDLDNGYIKLLKKCIDHNITVFSMHTNFDSIKMNYILASMLNIENQEVLSMRENLGIYGDIKPIKANELIIKVKELFKLSVCDYNGDPDKTLSKVAIVGGSGSSLYLDCIEKGIDVLITGDVTYSRSLEARRLGLNILNVSHTIEDVFTKEIISNLKETKLTLIESEIKSDFRTYY